MDREEKSNITTILAILRELTNENREKALWVMQGMLIAGQNKKND